MKKSTLFTLLSVFVLIPGALLLGRVLPGRSHYLTSTLVIVFILIPFFLSYAFKPIINTALKNIFPITKTAPKDAVRVIYFLYLTARPFRKLRA